MRIQKYSLLALFNILLFFPAANAHAECAIPNSGRTLHVPPVRTRVDMGGSNSLVTSKHFGAGALNKPLTTVQTRLRVELFNLSDQVQPVTLYLRKDSQYALTGIAGFGAGPVAFTVQPHLTSCSEGYSVTVGPNEGVSLFVDWNCTIASANTGSCDLILSSPQSGTSQSTTYPFTGFRNPSPPAVPGDLQVDSSSNGVSQLTFHIASDLGALIGSITTIALRNGGFASEVVGDTSLPLNGGRPF